MLKHNRNLFLALTLLLATTVTAFAQAPAPVRTASLADSAPSALPESPRPQPNRIAEAQSPAARSISLGGEGHAADGKFWAITGLMVGSTVANVEYTTRCMDAGRCKLVPDALRSRGALYGVSLPLNVGVGYLGYALKARGQKLWFLPAALVTAGNVVYATHAARWTR